MAYSTQRAVSDGTLQVLSLSINFFEQGEISVFVSGMPYYDYAWISQNSIRFNSPIPQGVEVLLRRRTEYGEPRHIFSMGSPFNNKTLDENFEQILRVGQEGVEGLLIDGLHNHLNMGGYRIFNLADPFDDYDAMNRKSVRDDIERYMAGGIPSGDGWFQQDGANTINRTFHSKLRDYRTLKDYGGIGDGVADERAALTAMSTAKGFIVLSGGDYLIPANYSITVPIYFEPGAAIVNPTGITLDIFNRIHSVNQQIFKGSGTVRMRLAETGEDAQDVQAGWFGVFASNRDSVDVSDATQRALSSISTQTREGIVRFPVGSFHLSRTMYVPRGVQVIGAGMRRTIFDITGLNFTVFETAGNACKFTDFQFEYPSGQGGVRTQPYIHVKHNTAEIDNIWFFPCTVGILVDESQCVIRNIRVTYGLDPKSAGSDTSLIWVRSNSFSIEGVKVLNTTFAPHYIVRIGGGSATQSVGSVSGILSSGPAIPVYVDANSSTMTRFDIHSIVVSPTGANRCEALVKIKASAAFLANYITMRGLVGNSNVDCLTWFESSDTAIVEHISVSSGQLQSAAGDGIKIVSGSTTPIRYLNYADDVDVAGRTNKMNITGAVTLSQFPNSMLGMAPVRCQELTVPPETAVVVADYRSNMFAGHLSIGSSTPNVNGEFSFRAAATSNHVTLIAASSPTTMATSNSNLTGTTGAAGKFTVGIRGPGQLVLENRTGSSVVVAVTLSTGP